MLVGIFVWLTFRTPPQVLNDQTVKRAVEERMPQPGRLCSPGYARIDGTHSQPLSAESKQEIDELASLGLITAEPDPTAADSFVLSVTPKGQPFFVDGQLCLAQYRYGHLLGLADQRVNDSGMRTVVAKIEPMVEPVSGVPADWLTTIQSTTSLRGMDAELVETPDGWKAKSVSHF